MGLPVFVACESRKAISIHPSRVGWDRASRPERNYYRDFNPPIPCGMGPLILRALVIAAAISIHPSRVGWDSIAANMSSSTATISIHPSRVGWDPEDFGGLYDQSISIHPSRVGWDPPNFTNNVCHEISIHPSRVGWDRRVDGFGAVVITISIHPSRVGWDRRQRMRVLSVKNFNPPIPCGMGLCARHPRPRHRYFNPPIPCGMGRF